MLLNEIAALRAPYIVEPTGAGWRVTRLNADNGAFDGAEPVMHRHEAVALAYADAAAALERYLASRDRCEDSAELFEIWRALDDRYELLAIEQKDSPVRAVTDPWAIAAIGSVTLH